MVSSDGLQAVVAGHICLDIAPAFKREGHKDIMDILAPGKLTNVEGVSISTGGAVANTGMALAILGINTVLMGKIGDDYFGGIVLKLAEKRGFSRGMRVVRGASTSYTVILAPPGVDRIFLHDPGANDTFCADDIDYGLVAGARLFHFGYPPIMRRMFSNHGEELVEIFRRVKGLGVTTSLDMCLPDPSSEAGRADWEGILKRLLPYVDIFAPSIEETLYMLDRQYFKHINEISRGKDIVEALDMDKLPFLGRNILDMGARVAVIKCGIKGYYIKTSGPEAIRGMGKAAPPDTDKWASRELLQEAFRAPAVVSTTGAGDTSLAGFIAALLKGMSIEDSLRVACATGAECVQAYDALSGIKPLEETVELLKKGWEKVRLSMESSYCRYDPQREIWAAPEDAKES